MGREQKGTGIPERDVYRLVMRSHLPAAEEFEEWVVGTVLPSIRKNGGYIAGQERLVTGEMTTEELVPGPRAAGGELRILDVDLAVRLGFERPRKIRELITRWLPELEKLGGCATVARVVSGNEVDEFYLNRKQAIFITGKSDTPARRAVHRSSTRPGGFLPTHGALSLVTGARAIMPTVLTAAQAIILALPMLPAAMALGKSTAAAWCF